MITKLLKAWGTVKPWFIGFLLSTAGMFMGYNLGSETARELGGQPGIWARICKGLSGVDLQVACNGLNSSYWGKAYKANSRNSYRLFSRVCFGANFPSHIHLEFKLVLDWILDSGYHIWIISVGTTVVDIPSLLKTSLPLGIVQFDRMVIDRFAWINFGVNDAVYSIQYGIVTGLGFVQLVLQFKSNLPGSHVGLN